jgi:hypothetical protein
MYSRASYEMYIGECICTVILMINVCFLVGQRIVQVATYAFSFDRLILHGVPIISVPFEHTAVYIKVYFYFMHSVSKNDVEKLAGLLKKEISIYLPAIRLRQYISASAP